MSSTYRPICLSHDPALIFGPELAYDDVAGLTRDDFDGHNGCDIVIGRFSYPLIEVACLGHQITGPTGCCTHHRSPEWVDKDWLRLLVASTTPPNAVDREVLRPLTQGCWPLERLNRLRAELEIPQPPTTTLNDDATPAAGQHAGTTHVPPPGEPLPLTEEQLLPWLTVFWYHQLVGITTSPNVRPQLLRAYPPCPACGTPPREVSFADPRTLLGVSHMGLPCGHIFKINDSMRDRLDEAARQIAQDQADSAPGFRLYVPWQP